MAAPAAASSLVATLVPGMMRIAQTGTPPGSAGLLLYAAKAETESFQIAIHANGSNLSNVNVSISDFVGPGTIAKSNVTLYRENFVQLNTPSPGAGWANAPDTMPGNQFTDALIPFLNPATGQPLTGGALQAVPYAFPNGQNMPVWADVAVPRTAAAGLYSATITITSDQGSTTNVVQLHVWNFALPLTPSLHSAITTDASAAEATMLLQHRLMPNPADSASKEATYAAQYGLSDVFAWPGFWSGVDNGCETPSQPPPTVATFQAEAARHTTGAPIYSYSFDEITNCTGVFDTVKQWARNMHQAGIKNLAPVGIVPALMDDGSGTGASAIDIWVLLPFQFDTDMSQVPTVQAKGNEVWSYNTLTQDSFSPKWEIDYAPINFRIQTGMINQSLGLQGLLYWRIDDWVNADPWTNPYLSISGGMWAGEGILVYPGTKVGLPAGSVVPSMRLKEIRKGVDDFEYVQMLKNLGQSAWALALVKTIASDWHTWTRDPAQLEAVREQLGTKIEQLSGGAPNACDVSGDGNVNVLDVQLEVNQALGMATCNNDINQDHACNVLDVQIVATAAASVTCNHP
jgi:hypothetical protein